MNRQAAATWLSRPRVESSFLYVTFLLEMMACKAFYSLNFFEGRAMVSNLVFKYHPSIVKDSESVPSSPSFPSDI